ncbi:hypothetical protein L218DRAFT_975160 [Marasmius fiardii PR-910]|nr:hypothetical protein L218DRAFT_975160 [Marasmius fiardii PR-910]
MEPLMMLSISDSATINTAPSSSQDSTTLVTSMIATGFAQNGAEIASEGHTLSETSTNNFINICMDRPWPLASAQQVDNQGTCNPIPIGVLPPKSLIPTFKFAAPIHGSTLSANTPFLIRLNINLEFSMTDSQTRYLSAPQQLASNGHIQGYARVVIETLTAINQTTPTDPQKVAFAAAIGIVDDDGALVTNATDGVPPGFYRISSIALTENHYPVAVPILQSGAVNAVYTCNVTGFESTHSKFNNW